MRDSCELDDITICPKKQLYPFDQVFQNFDFDESLMVEPLLVPDDFDSYALPCLVIATLQDLTERTFTEETHDLVAIGQVIALDMDIIASFVIVAMVVDGRFGCSLILFAFLSRVPYLLVVQDLPALIEGQGLEMCLYESWITRRMNIVSTPTPRCS